VLELERDSKASEEEKQGEGFTHRYSGRGQHRKAPTETLSERAAKS